MATGGPGIFGKSTNSMINTGSAASVVYQQGKQYANGEVQIHPTAPGDDKLRLWWSLVVKVAYLTYKDGKPWYFVKKIS